MGPYIVSIFQYISYKMQRYTVYSYLETVLHVSGGTSIHHQERIQLYLQHLVFVRPLLLPAAIAVDKVVCAPDDGWRYHPKHVEPFPDINKLCKVATCWIYVYWRIFTMHGTMNVKLPVTIFRFRWNLNFSTDFPKILKKKFHENLSVGSRVVQWGRTERQTDRHEEANSRFSQFCKRV